MNRDPARPLRLLVIDDQRTNLKIVGDILGRLGFDILLADDGDQALLHLGTSPVDLILLDVLMPGCDGIEVCRRIRANPEWAEIPIIFLSAAADKPLIVRALEAGGVDYVTKPFNPAELTSRVRTHLALKTTRDRLRQLVEDKEELLGILAHDLQNHLASMTISAELVRGRARKHRDASLERMAANIHTATNQMFAFVGGFLANSAADRGLELHIEPVSLNEAVAAVVSQYDETARRKDIALLHSGAPTAPVAADRVALDQVLGNLVSNALKFSPPHTTVRVSVEPDLIEGGAICRVQDQGPGFTEKDRAQLFQRYGRLSARPTGGEPSTGLGLSIVKKLMRDLGGTVVCESRPGEGATFILTLPPCAAAILPPRSSAASLAAS